MRLWPSSATSVAAQPISLVAAGDGKAGEETDTLAVRAEPVSTALLLALVVGVAQGLLYALSTDRC